MKKTKRWISLLLTVIMTAGLFAGLPVNFAAAEEKKEYKVGDIISYGTYPQTQVTDESLIAELNAQKKEWKSYGYYSGTGSIYGATFGSNLGTNMFPGDWMQYCDVKFRGNMYRGVEFSQYRPFWTDGSSGDHTSYQDDHGYYTDTVYWFLWEPLTWIVLDPSVGLVLSEKIIDAQAFSNTDKIEYPMEPPYSNNYENSTVRKWLSTEFYNSVFNLSEQDNIGIVSIDNSAVFYGKADSGKKEYNGTPTEDRVFLISSAEFRNYTFKSPSCTDYSFCQGLPGSGWWLRTAGDVEFRVFCASGSDLYLNGHWSLSPISHVCVINGIRPAFQFKDGIMDETGSRLIIPQNSKFYMLPDSTAVFPYGGTAAVEVSALLESETVTGADVQWTCSDPSVVQVTPGAVTDLGGGKWRVGCNLRALKPGNITLTAKVDGEDGAVSDSVTVKVGTPELKFPDHDRYYTYVGSESVYRDDGDTPYDLTAQLKSDSEFITGADVCWKSSDERILTIGEASSMHKISEENEWMASCKLKPLKAGRVEVTAYIGGIASATAEIEVLSELKFSVTYDRELYYGGGAFLGENSAISDSVNFYLYFENVGDEKAKKSGTAGTIEPIKPITLTASVDRGSWIFERGGAPAAAYTQTYDEIPFGTAIDDLLTLYPNTSMSLGSTENQFKLNLKLESESFEEPIVAEYHFKVTPAAQKKAKEHIDWFDSNADYKWSKQNYYGDMSELKKSKKYWYETFLDVDLTNYYEVVTADLVMSLLNVEETKPEQAKKGVVSSFVDELVDEIKTLKAWKSNYQTVVGELTSIAKGYDYEGSFAISESKIDKLLKKSPYVTEPEKVKDKFRDGLVKLFDSKYEDTINGVFAGVEKFKQLKGFFKGGKSIVNDLKDFVDRMALYDTYLAADDALKDVLADLAGRMPTGLMREAVNDYVHYAAGTGGYMLEFYESLAKTSVKIGSTAFKTLMGKQFADFTRCKVMTWLGAKTTKAGVALSKTTAFATTVGVLGASYTLGKLASDLLCNSTDEHRETSRIIAMADLSDYITETLQHYEDLVRSEKSDDAVSRFEYALQLQKACQS